VAETKTKTIVNGQMVDASDVPVTAAKEDWSLYKLEDGTELRVKLTVGSILRLADQYDADNNPVYVVKGTVLTLPVVVPESLRKNV
jgi:hypothetical protein